MNRPCDYHGRKNLDDPPANNTNRNCWIYKKMVKQFKNVKANKQDPSNDDDEDEPQPEKGNGWRK